MRMTGRSLRRGRRKRGGRSGTCPTTKRTIVTVNMDVATTWRESSSSREENRINSLFRRVRTRTQKEMSRFGGESERKRELGEILN